MAVISDRHIIFTSAEAVDSIIAPLKSFNIDHFVYVKKFADGSSINLCNRTEWSKIYYDNKFDEIGVFESAIDNYQSGYALWNTFSDDPVFKVAREQVNLKYGVTIIKKGKDMCEFYYIGSTDDQPQLLNFFINNLDILNRFILYFKEQAAVLIEEATKHRLRPANYLHLKKLEQQYSIPELLRKPEDHLNFKKQFMRNTKIRNFQVSLNNQAAASLSNRELDCLKLLLAGKTAPSIARELFISSRTVEKHIQNIKIKFNCNKKSDIISILLKNGWCFYGDHCDIFM